MLYQNASYEKSSIKTSYKYKPLSVPLEIPNVKYFLGLSKL